MSVRRLLTGAVPLICLHLASLNSLVTSQHATGQNVLQNILKETLQNAGSDSRKPLLSDVASSAPNGQVAGGVTDALASVTNSIGVPDGSVREGVISDVLANSPLASLMSGGGAIPFSQVFTGGDIGANPFFSVITGMTPEGIDQIISAVNRNNMLSQMAKTLAGADPSSTVPVDFEQLATGFTRLASGLTGSNGPNPDMLEELSRVMSPEALASFNFESVAGMMNADGTINGNFLQLLENFGNPTVSQASDSSQQESGTQTRHFNKADVKPASVQKSETDSINDPATPSLDESDFDDSVTVPTQILESDQNDFATILSRLALLGLNPNVSGGQLSKLLDPQGPLDSQSIQNLIAALQSAAGDTSDSNLIDALTRQVDLTNPKISEGLMSPQVVTAVDIAGIPNFLNEDGGVRGETLSKVLQNLYDRAEQTSAPGVTNEVPTGVSENALEEFREFLAEITGDSFQPDDLSLDNFLNGDGTINTEFVNSVASSIAAVRQGDFAAARQASNAQLGNLIADLIQGHLTNLLTGHIATTQNAADPQGVINKMADITNGSSVSNGVMDIAASLLDEGGMLANSDISTFVTEDGGVNMGSVTEALSGIDLGDVRQFLESFGLSADESVTAGEVVSLLSKNMNIDENGTVTVNEERVGTLKDSEGTLLLIPFDDADDAGVIEGAGIANLENRASLGSTLNHLVHAGGGELASPAAAITGTVQNVLSDDASNNIIHSVGNALRNSQAANGSNILNSADSMRSALGNTVGGIVANRAGNNPTMSSVEKAMNEVLARGTGSIQNVASNTLSDGFSTSNVAKTVADVVTRGNGSLQEVAENVLGSSGANGDGTLSALGEVAGNLGVDNASELLDIANLLNVSSTSTVDDVIKSISGSNGNIIDRIQKATGFPAEGNALLRGRGDLIDQAKLASDYLSSLNKVIFETDGLNAEATTNP